MFRTSVLFIVAVVALAFGMAVGVAAQTVPGAPMDVRAVAWPYTVIVYFTPPASDGGSAITNYKVAAWSLSGGTYYTAGWIKGSGPTSPIMVEGGPKQWGGNSCYFKVTATNAVGDGPPSPPSSNAVVPTDGTSPLVYSKGVFYWQGTYDFNGTSTFTDTTGHPASGTYDVRFTGTASSGMWQPWAPGSDYDLTGYKYLELDLKPTVKNTTWTIGFMKVGDKSIGSIVTLPSDAHGTYGAAPVVGQWASSRIPLVNFNVGPGTPNVHIFKFSVCGGATTWYTTNVKFTAVTDGPSESATQATGGPSAPTNFLLTHQGANDAVLTWTAAVAGPSPVSYYNIYRNGVAYDKTSSTTYTDSKATNITTPGYGPQPYVPASIYNYAVSAVDTQGHEGPQQKQCTAWVYHGGVDYWRMAKNSYNGGVSYNPTDTAGSPQNGAPYDIAVTVTNRSNWWQPFSGQPFLHNMTPTTWAMELGAFNYMTIDLKPTVAGQTWQLNIISRVSSGDNFNSGSVILGGAEQKFGPQAQPGKWATYKVPFLNAFGFANGSSLQVGIGKYYGSISGTSLTVTKMVSGMNVQGSSYLSGAGIRPGTASSTGTYVLGSNATSGQAGTYAIAPSQSAANTLITAQRTNMYKFSLMDLTGMSRNTYYVDNIGFTTQ